MTNQDGSEQNSRWPPRRVTHERPHQFMVKCAIDGGREYSWPPLPGSDAYTTAELLKSGFAPQTQGSQGPGAPGQYGAGQQIPGQQNVGGPNMTMTYPSAFKLRDEAPVDHHIAAQIVPSQPALKSSNPEKFDAETKWPPKGYRAEDQVEEIREVIRPRKEDKDYSAFFSQNKLPNNYPGYKIPPGTQHAE